MVRARLVEHDPSLVQFRECDVETGAVLVLTVAQTTESNFVPITWP